ncbi:hypothetical protein ALNOE001_21830 [Candidatus Methanobinarius endosymbioticus]|uniref:PRC-barrel domain-containing protein n=1 Tax=Candidatus Methanobinarius endosymbioticus TaxID=2006182 RepID=A0A366M8B6_9EURY|nr:hypothetical protein ALNOE001_21830 [Candidatus Methanobinarius endosymbioticus]
MSVIDRDGQEVGKVDEIKGLIKTITINLDKGLFSRDKKTLIYAEIRNITDNVLLDIKIDLDD